MLLNSVSNINTNLGRRVHMPSDVTAEQIATVTDSWKSDIIKSLEAQGLINKKMLIKVRKAAEAQKAINTANSINKVINVIEKPVYLLERRDNGYFYTYESPYDFRKNWEGYAIGPRKYSTPVLADHREYIIALENIRKNGNIEDIKFLSKFMKKNIASDITNTHIAAMEMLSKISSTMLSVCTPQKGSYGLVHPMDKKAMQAFVQENIFTPLCKTIDSFGTRWKSGIKTLR